MTGVQTCALPISHEKAPEDRGGAGLRPWQADRGLYGPSLGELEAKAKAGEQISLTDLAAAVKAEEKAPKTKKSRAAKPKKPSIRAQLDAAKKEQSKQTQPREKTKELEV